VYRVHLAPVPRVFRVFLDLQALLLRLRAFRVQLVLQDRKGQLALKELKDSSARRVHLVQDSLAHKVYRVVRASKVHQALVSQGHKVCKEYRVLRVFKGRLARKGL